MAHQSVATELDWTGLDRLEADALRIYCNKRKIPMPLDTAEKARMYFEVIAKTKVPADIIAKTGRPAEAPEATPAALRLIEAAGLDIQTIEGSIGPTKRIGVPDVRKAAAKALPAMVAAAGGGAKMAISPTAVADTVRGFARAAEAEQEAEAEAQTEADALVDAGLSAELEE